MTESIVIAVVVNLVVALFFQWRRQRQVAAMKREIEYLRDWIKELKSQ